MKKIVLTGSPHSGKTTVIEALAKRGYIVIPETAIEVIDILNNLMGLEGALKWRGNHIRGFQELIIERQFFVEDGISTTIIEPIFLDRGVHDGIAFARHYQKTCLDNATKHMQSVRYDQVFLLDLVVPFNNRGDSGRVETIRDCHALQAQLYDVYTEIGLEPILVPLMPVEERVNFILERT